MSATLTKPPHATVEFAWEEPDAGDVYATRWFPREYRDRLDTEPGRWGRIAANAGNHVHVELRKRFPDYEFVGRREDLRGRLYTVYARRKAES